MLTEEETQKIHRDRAVALKDLVLKSEEGKYFLNGPEDRFAKTLEYKQMEIEYPYNGGDWKRYYPRAQRKFDILVHLVQQQFPESTVLDSIAPEHLKWDGKL